MAGKSAYKHWRLETDEDHVLWLTLDRQGSSVNSLNRQIFEEFNLILEQIAAEKPAGVIIISGKKNGFVAGADITQFTQLKTCEEAFDLIRQAQLVLDKLEALPMPTVAMISGFCLGGGMELALACRYRVAEDQPGTKIGLPEVKLGIHPGWGGTVRLPPLIGALNAMDMMLTGRALSATAAAKLGVVDAAVSKRELRRAAKFYVTHKPKPHKPKGVGAWSNKAFLRPMLAKVFYKKLAEKHVNPEHYPAPYAIVKNWMKDGSKSDALIREARSIAELMVTDTSRNLVRVFFLQTQMKDLAKQIKADFKHVHVIGAGTMGGDIAAWCAYKGMKVTLQDQSPERIAPAIKRAAKFYQKKLKIPRLIQATMDRLQPDVHGDGVHSADVIIEAVFENLEVKQKIFKSVEARAKSSAILATNTSSIPLEEIGSVLKDPSRLVGIHFFNPVTKMPLVEVVHGIKTSQEVAQKACAFVGKIDRSPLPVASRPGFLVNRCLMPYLMEAMVLLEEGVPAAAIDKAALHFGMPMGPVTLADTVGLDICLSVAENLTKHFGGTIPERLKQMVAAGQLGVKSGKGFFQYKEGRRIKPQKASSERVDPDMTDRMILRMLNEAVACLQEKVIDNPDLLDAGMIFGTGFAPFRGGPIHYAKSRGIKEVLEQLEHLRAKYGDRFKPNAGWSLISERKTDVGVGQEKTKAGKPAEPQRE